MNTSPFKPEPIKITTSGGMPSRVYFKKGLRVVREISNLWRVDDGWWSMPISRIYYVLELESGSRITVFHDLLQDRWYKQAWAT